MDSLSSSDSEEDAMSVDPGATVPILLVPGTTDMSDDSDSDDKIRSMYHIMSPYHVPGRHKIKNYTPDNIGQCLHESHDSYEIVRTGDEVGDHLSNEAEPHTQNQQVDIPSFEGTDMSSDMENVEITDNGKHELGVQRKSDVEDQTSSDNNSSGDCKLDNIEGHQKFENVDNYSETVGSLPRNDELTTLETHKSLANVDKCSSSAESLLRNDESTAASLAKCESASPSPRHPQLSLNKKAVNIEKLSEEYQEICGDKKKPNQQNETKTNDFLMEDKQLQDKAGELDNIDKTHSMVIEGSVKGTTNTEKSIVDVMKNDDMSIDEAMDINMSENHHNIEKGNENEDVQAEYTSNPAVSFLVTDTMMADISTREPVNISGQESVTFDYSFIEKTPSLYQMEENTKRETSSMSPEPSKDSGSTEDESEKSVELIEKSYDSDADYLSAEEDTTGDNNIGGDDDENVDDEEEEEEGDTAGDNNIGGVDDENIDDDEEEEDGDTAGDNNIGGVDDVNVDDDEEEEEGDTAGDNNIGGVDDVNVDDDEEEEEEEGRFQDENDMFTTSLTEFSIPNIMTLQSTVKNENNKEGSSDSDSKGQTSECVSGEADSISNSSSSIIIQDQSDSFGGFKSISSKIEEEDLPYNASSSFTFPDRSEELKLEECRKQYAAETAAEIKIKTSTDVDALEVSSSEVEDLESGSEHQLDKSFTVLNRESSNEDVETEKKDLDVSLEKVQVCYVDTNNDTKAKADSASGENDLQESLIDKEEEEILRENEDSIPLPPPKSREVLDYMSSFIPSEDTTNISTPPKVPPRTGPSSLQSRSSLTPKTPLSSIQPPVYEPVQYFGSPPGSMNPPGVTQTQDSYSQVVQPNMPGQPNPNAMSQQPFHQYNPQQIPYMWHPPANLTVEQQQYSMMMYYWYMAQQQHQLFPPTQPSAPQMSQPNLGYSGHPASQGPQSFGQIDQHIDHGPGNFEHQNRPVHGQPTVPNDPRFMDHRQLPKPSQRGQSSNRTNVEKEVRPHQQKQQSAQQKSGHANLAQNPSPASKKAKDELDSKSQPSVKTEAHGDSSSKIKEVNRGQLHSPSAIKNVHAVNQRDKKETSEQINEKRNVQRGMKVETEKKDQSTVGKIMKGASPQTKDSKPVPTPRKRGDRTSAKHQPERPQAKHEPERPQAKHQPERPQAKHQPERPQAKHQPERPQAKHQPEKPQAKHQPETQRKKKTGTVENVKKTEDWREEPAKENIRQVQKGPVEVKCQEWLLHISDMNQNTILENLINYLESLCDVGVVTDKVIHDQTNASALIVFSDKPDTDKLFTKLQNKPFEGGLLRGQKVSPPTHIAVSCDGSMEQPQNLEIYFEVKGGGEVKEGVIESEDGSCFILGFEDTKGF